MDLEAEPLSVSIYAIAAMAILVLALVKCLWESPKPIPNETARWALIGYGFLFVLWVMNMPTQSLLVSILGLAGSVLVVAIGLVKEPHKGEIGHDPDDPNNRY